jgi:hypothetical protein
MSSNVIPHPYHDLMAEAKRERKIVDSAEAEVLRDRIVDAVDAYSQFLERHDLIWGDYDDPAGPRLKAQALVVTHDYGRANGIDITLKEGALDRVYGNGRNPDYEGRGPPDIPHRLRSDD